MILDSIIAEALKRGASDIHISVGRAVTFRINGELVSFDQKSLLPENTEAISREITSEDQRKTIEKLGGVDFGFSFKDSARVRVSCFKGKGNYGVVLRLLPNRNFSFEEIGLSEKAIQL